MTGSFLIVPPVFGGRGRKPAEDVTVQIVSDARMAALTLMKEAIVLLDEAGAGIAACYLQLAIDEAERECGANTARPADQ